MFTIHRDHPQPRLITLGKGIEPPVESKPKRGAKNMAEEKAKDIDVTVGVKTVREDDAGKQGAIGNDNPPTPKQPEGDVKVGNDKGDADAE